MATAAAAEGPNSEAGTTAAAEPKASGGGKRRLILIGAPVAFVGVGAGLWFTGILPGLLGMRHDEKSAEREASSAPIFVDLPELIANLNSNPQRPSYVKLTVRLEVRQQQDVERVKATMPRLQDLFLTYIREMRPQELRGSAGTYRLREELIARANLAAAPAKITDVLFTQMLVQ
ncbi:MAG TPA: flagellar basal body-associated FliL family protein [Acetobacteraceae bacterium]|nr:flagellar basal body-associated FliL family protein [Acetobacteraceae bacterium]